MNKPILPKDAFNTNNLKTFCLDLTEKTILNTLPDAVSVLTHHGQSVFFNQAWANDNDLETIEKDHPEDWETLLSDRDSITLQKVVKQALPQGLPFSQDMLLRNSQKDAFWRMVRLTPYRVVEGQVLLWLLTLTDIEDRKQTELGLLRKNKLLMDMLNISQDCIKVLTPDGRLQHMNKSGCMALGVDEHSGFGMQWLPLLPQEVREKGEEALHAARNGKHARFSGMSCVPDEDPRYWDNLLSPVPDASGTVDAILCISRDVTVQHHSEQRIELLMHELNHRSKNTLAVIQALIRRTVPDPKADYVSVLDKRLISVAKSQDILVKGEWAAMTVHDLILSQTAVAGDLLGSRIILQGDPSLRLKENMAEIIGLPLHELTTNAVKYGALSNLEGVVTISWDIETTETGKIFHMDWQEAHGPDVHVPDHTGFGSILIARHPANAKGVKISYTFPEGGVKWALSVPADIMLQTPHIS